MKPIPAEMSKQLRIADRLTCDDIARAMSHARARVIEVGRRFGWSEAELIERGLIDAEPLHVGAVLTN